MFGAMLRAVSLAAALVLLAATAGAQSARTPLEQAVAATQAAKADYAFDLDLDTSKQNWRARFDPNAQPQLRLVQPTREALDGGERRAFDGMAERLRGRVLVRGRTDGARR